MNNLHILFIGDIVGSLGRKAISQLLPEIKKEFSLDLVIANGENAAHGRGITLLTAQELLSNGIDFLTTGDHCFDQSTNIEACFSGALPIIRPANYGIDAPGEGYKIVSHPKGDILIINLLGRTFMSRHYECPFRKTEEILESFTNKKFSAIIVDIHAEATSEKIALRHFLNGKISALFGTHTHVQTADGQISSVGTAYLSDVGMTGQADGVIGIEASPIIATFLTQIRQPHALASAGRAILNGVIITIDTTTARCLDITPIQREAFIE